MDSPMMGGGGLLPGSAAGFLDLDRRHHHHPSHLHQIQIPADSDHPMPQFDPERPAATRGKGLLSSASTASDDDDPGGADPSSRSRKGSPWQRMKWTDDVVRLLISLVAHVGDDGGGAEDPPSAAARRRQGPALQKKGKWKAVSKLMLERGCYVSPQQCEDKFNDLNKRYKRLNDILGRGTSCQVVENPALLDSMPHIPPKAKEDVRKILSSKHLFYREMCAYHNGQRIPNSQDIGLLLTHEAQAPPHDAADADAGAGADAVSDEDDDGESDDEEDEEEEERGSDGSGGRRRLQGLERLRAEMDGVLRDPAMSVGGQREWFARRALRLREERVELEAEALELDRRLFRWHRFRSKKDRELEGLTLENERLRLENERMLLQVRHKELELERDLDLARKRPQDPSAEDAAHLRTNEIELGRLQ